MLQTLAQPKPGSINMNHINHINNKISNHINFSDLRHALSKGLVVEEFHPLRFFILLLILYAYVNRTPGESLLASFVKTPVSHVHAMVTGVTQTEKEVAK